MPPKLSKEQHAKSVTELYREGIALLQRLEKAGAHSSHNPNLTPPEWEVLGNFDLHNQRAICRRMEERALLAAYDGAPGALTELRIEQAEVSSSDEQILDPSLKEFANLKTVNLESRMLYEPETHSACLRFMVTKWLIEGSRHEKQNAACLSDYFSTLFHPHTGRVMQRAYSTIGQGSGSTTNADKFREK